MTLTKAEINRAIKTNGRVQKRTKAEIVDAIQYQAMKYGVDSVDIITALLWTLDFGPKKARACAERLIITACQLTAATSPF